MRQQHGRGVRGLRGIGLARSAIAGVAFTGLAIAAVGCDTQIDDSDIELMPLAEVKRQWDRNPNGANDRVGLIDARSPSAFAEGHIPGARSVALPDVDPERRRDPSLTRFGTLVVYGRNPGDAAARGLTKRMLEAKYDDVFLFSGGIEEWVRAGYPVTSPADAPR